MDDLAMDNKDAKTNRQRQKYGDNQLFKIDRNKILCSIIDGVFLG